MDSAPDEYGVFGHPVGHSLSPFIHGLFARATGQHMVYRPYEVESQHLSARVAGFFARGGRGLNLTLPHKIAAVELAEQLTARAAHAQAVNTLLMKDDQLLGDNTDGAGLVRDLTGNLGLRLARRRVLILGAGGATRGILAPLLALEPALVVLANRTPERALALAAAFHELGPTQGVAFGDIEDAPFDVVINATSASLSGEVPPLPEAAVGAHTFCYDLAYGRSALGFVRWAQSRGAHALQGVGMLVEQAAESFRLWRGVRPATAEVLTALRARIGA
ncbi:MAG: shikimate dehydrogenase [Gammaproteobacteria bacterium]|nr:shikimate dehydrogenase [Gammaproteobacteria bacterium]